MKKNKKKRLERLGMRKKERREKRRGGDFEQTVQGTLTVTPAGFGFVKIAGEETEQDVFIPPQFIGNAMNGDEVVVGILPARPGSDDDSKGPAGRVLSVEKRKRERLVGEVIAGNKIRPLSRRLQNDIPLAGGKKGAKRGDWVEIKLLEGEDNSDEVSGKIIRSIGKAGTIQSDLDAVCAEFDLVEPYTEEDNQRASLLEIRPIERRDFCDQWTVTVDPTDAKDFDDALSLAPGEKKGQWLLGVHISDVAAWIAPKSEFDKEAVKRGFTAYLPGRTLPMLPRDLTAKISLREGVQSPAHSVIFTLDGATGAILSGYRCHSLIKVDRRMSYQEVQELIDDPKMKHPDWDRTFVKNLKTLLDLTGKMRKIRRQTEDFIDLAIPEIRVMCDENADRINGLAKKEQREADFLVEECMLAANSFVGTELVEKHIPGLFRIHPSPEPEKIAEFSQMVSDTFGIVPGDLTSRRACNEFLNKLPHDERRPVVLNLFLRSLPRASYSEKADLHFGLGKGRYCHFTSPTRRYTDLAVHQQLWNADLNQRLKNTATFAKLAVDLSEKEENNDNAYFTASDRLKLRYLQEKLDASGENFYEGVISKITSGGLMVEIADLGTYGFVDMDDLPGEFYRTNNRLKSSRGHKEYKVGDFIYLRLYAIDFVKGQAKFRISN